MFYEKHKLLMSRFFFEKSCLMSGLTFALSEVTLFLPNNLSRLKNIYIYIQAWYNFVLSKFWGFSKDEVIFVQHQTMIVSNTNLWNVENDNACLMIVKAWIKSLSCFLLLSLLWNILPIEYSADDPVNHLLGFIYI